MTTIAAADLQAGTAVRLGPHRVAVLMRRMKETPKTVNWSIRWVEHEDPEEVGEWFAGGATKRKTTKVEVVDTTRCWCGYTSTDPSALRVHYPTAH